MFLCVWKRRSRPRARETKAGPVRRISATPDRPFGPAKGLQREHRDSRLPASMAKPNCLRRKPWLIAQTGAPNRCEVVLKELHFPPTFQLEVGPATVVTIRLIDYNVKRSRQEHDARLQAKLSISTAAISHDPLQHVVRA